MLKHTVCYVLEYREVCLCSSHEYSGPVDANEFALRLWGDIYFDASTRKFTRHSVDPEEKRTFVHFILEPLYKLYTQASALVCSHSVVD